MPYKKISDAPANVRKLDGTNLTLSQVNWIARVVDGIPEGQVENPWAVAIAQFKRAHTIEEDKWVKNDEKTEKEDYSVVVVTKQDDRYWITAVSTAAIPDRIDETFTVKAIDHDIELAKKTGIYPEFRLWHKQGLGIGKVEKMSRVGIFAVDEGWSYDDPFSLDVCKNMLENNDGTWRNSRGFYVRELSGHCSSCDQNMRVTKEHMKSGFKCPSCGKVYMKKGALRSVRFLKARTFDVTITDNPCLPITGVSAKQLKQYSEDFQMEMKELRKKLIKAGVSESVIDERFESLDKETLKEYEDAPFAEVLKEFDADEGDDEYFVLDPEVIKDFTDATGEIVEETVAKVFKDLEPVVRKVVSEVLSDANIEVSLEDADFELKEVPDIVDLKAEVVELKEMISKLLEEDEVKLKELLEETPRGGRLRIRRFKGNKPKDDEDMDDEDEDMDDEDEEEEKKEYIPGTQAVSMTEFVIGTDKKRG